MCKMGLKKYFGLKKEIYPFKGPLFKIILTMRAGQNMQLHNFFKKCEMDPPYNVHLTQNSCACKPNTKIVHQRLWCRFPFSFRLSTAKDRCSNDEGGHCQFFIHTNSLVGAKKLQLVLSDSSFVPIGLHRKHMGGGG